jgi:hypothetical protein
MKQEELSELHNQLHVAIQDPYFRHGPLHLMFWRRHPDDLTKNVYYRVAPLDFQEDHESQEFEPTLRLSRELAQEFIDGLWSVGVRPTRFESLGETQAIKDHLSTVKAYATDFWGMIQKLSGYEDREKPPPIGKNPL